MRIPAPLRVAGALGVGIVGVDLEIDGERGRRTPVETQVLTGVAVGLGHGFGIGILVGGAEEKIVALRPARRQFQARVAIGRHVVQPPAAPAQDRARSIIAGEHRRRQAERVPAECF